MSFFVRGIPKHYVYFGNVYFINVITRSGQVFPHHTTFLSRSMRDAESHFRSDCQRVALLFPSSDPAYIISCSTLARSDYRKRTDELTLFENFVFDETSLTQNEIGFY